jgi:ParB family chromosome partitioning protein
MNRLGRGLSTLLKDIEKTTDGIHASVPIDYIKPNRYQPRKHFDADKLAELSESIKANGLIQPIIVCKLAENEYELIAGERRLNASKLAGLTEIPVYIKEVSDKERLVLAVVENIQRENLSPLEEADAYQRLIDEFDLTHADISSIMGKDRATITNTLRLLKLPDEIKIKLAEKQITAGHARAILSVDPEHMILFTNEIIKNKYSTSKSEEVSALYSEKARTVKPSKYKKTYDKSYLASVEKNLAEFVETTVKVKERKNAAGEIVISFFSAEQLEQIKSKITLKP